jgi:hypothetical protein
MDEATRLRMRRAHTSHGEKCECDRTVFGNGRVAHYRRCKAYLLAHGWPFNQGDSDALRAVARDCVALIEDPTERSAAFLKVIRDARMGEARRRGLI